MLYTGKGGASGLKKVETKKAEPGNGEEEGGVFTDPAAQEVLQKAKSITRWVESVGGVTSIHATPSVTIEAPPLKQENRFSHGTMSFRSLL